MPDVFAPPSSDALHETMVSSVVTTLLDIVCALVQEPHLVTIVPVASERDTVLVVTVGSNDMGKVIGKQGRTAESLRSVLYAIGSKRKHRFQLDIRSIGPRPVTPPAASSTLESL